MQRTKTIRWPMSVCGSTIVIKYPCGGGGRGYCGLFLIQEKQSPSSNNPTCNQHSHSRSHTPHPTFRITQQSLILQPRARTSHFLPINTRMSVRSCQHRRCDPSCIKGFGIRACRECSCCLTHWYIWILGRRRRGVGEEDESETWSRDWDCTSVVDAVNGGYVESIAETTVDCKVTTQILKDLLFDMIDLLC